MRVAISLGDLNGIGLEIALRSHEEVAQWCEPVYCIDPVMLAWGAALLGLDVPESLQTCPCGDVFDITPGRATKASGKASYASFLKALSLVQENKADALVTLPIHKEAWHKAGVLYKGHTDALEGLLKEDAMMMLGCETLFVGLFTHHIPLKNVAKQIKKKPLIGFLMRFWEALHVKPIGVLGLNPHAGDGGVIGKEERVIAKAIAAANEAIGEEVFMGPLVPDTAFTPQKLAQFSHLVCLYHDQGLTPLKALFFEESINVSLGLSVVRTSVDHGTAYDIAYKGMNPSCKSFLNATKSAITLAEKRRNFT